MNLRSICLFVCAATLISCEDQKIESEAFASPDEIREMLSVGNAKVCNLTVVQKLALIDEPEYANYLELGGEPLEFSAIRVADINREIGEIKCEATIRYRVASPDTASQISTEQIRYVVRKTLQGSYVVEATGGREAARSQARFDDLMAEYAARRNAQTLDPKPVITDAPTKAAATEMPKIVGDCSVSTITDVGTRLENDDGSSVEGSGSAVELANGVYGVSYDQVTAVDISRVGDMVRTCLMSVPTNCPAGDERGRVYATTNLRTGLNWQLPDSSHYCGGA